MNNIPAVLWFWTFQIPKYPDPVDLWVWKFRIPKTGIFPLFKFLEKRSNERSRNEHSYIELTKEGKKEKKKENFYY
jgi:hypothetical protein